VCFDLRLVYFPILSLILCFLTCIILYLIYFGLYIYFGLDVSQSNMVADIDLLDIDLVYNSGVVYNYITHRHMTLFESI